MGLERELPSPQTVHLYHPRPTPWSSLVSGISEALASLSISKSADPIPTIPISEWVRLLEEKAQGAGEDEVRRIPALKLLSFFEPLAQGDEALRTRLSPPDTDTDSAASEELKEALGFVTLATEKMQTISPTVKGMRSMEEEGGYPAKWIAYWHSKGLFN